MYCLQGREIWIVKLRGYDALNDSETLRGQTLLVSSTDKPEIEDEDDFLSQVCRLIFSMLQHYLHAAAGPCRHLKVEGSSAVLDANSLKLVS